jgi:hypothetical protein
MDDILGEFGDRPCNLLVEVLRPNYFTCIFGHVSNNRRISLLVVEHPLYNFQLAGVIGEDSVVFGSKVVFQSIPLNSVLKFFEKIDGVFNTFGFAEIIVNKLL